MVDEMRIDAAITSSCNKTASIFGGYMHPFKWLSIKYVLDFPTSLGPQGTYLNKALSIG
jgi:hypothetical protein